MYRHLRQQARQAWQLHRHRLYRQKMATSREMKKFMRHKRLIFARQLQQMQQRQDLLRRVHPIHRIGYTAEWSKVEYNGTTCYIASEYLSDKAPETVNQQVQAPSAATELWSGDLSTLSVRMSSAELQITRIAMR